MEVANLLELEGTFHRNRVHGAAAEEQRMLMVGKAQRQPVDHRVEFQRLLQQ